MTKEGFLDVLETIADKALGTLERSHYPGKEEDDEKSTIPDAEILTVESAYTIGFISGHGVTAYHVFVGQSCHTICDVTFKSRGIATLIPGKRGYFAHFCIPCVLKLIALQAQSPVKELTDGK